MCIMYDVTPIVYNQKGLLVPYYKTTVNDFSIFSINMFSL